MFGFFKRTSATETAPAEDMHTRDMIARDMHLRAETINETERSVEAVIATENRAAVFDMRRLEVIDEILLMDGVEIPRQVPMLENHMRMSLDTHLGSIRNIRRAENVRLADGTTIERALVGTLHFATGDAMPEAERAWQLVRQGHLTDVSTGNQALDGVMLEPGETASVNGREFTAGQRPLQITRRWRPREGSLTSVGADADARIRSDKPNRSDKGKPMKKVNGEKLAELAAEQTTSTRSFEQVEFELRAATDLSTEELNALVNGERSEVTEEQLAGFAAVLDAKPDILAATD